VRHVYPGGVILLRAFAASVAGRAPEAREHSELRWVDREQAAALDWAPADLPILEEVWPSR